MAYIREEDPVPELSRRYPTQEPRSRLLLSLLQLQSKTEIYNLLLPDMLLTPQGVR